MSKKDNTGFALVGSCFSLPCNLQLVGALLQQGADGLCIRQFLCTTDRGEVFVGVVSLQFAHLSGVAIAKQNELKGMESQNSGIFESLLRHAVFEIGRAHV